MEGNTQPPKKWKERSRVVVSDGKRARSKQETTGMYGGRR